MDDLNWDGSDVLEESVRILWNSQQQQNFEGCCYNKTNSLTHQIQEMHKVEIDHSAYSNSERVIMPSKNLLQHATTMTVKSKAGSSWEEPLVHQSDQSLLVNRPYNMPDFNLAHQQQQQLKFNNSFDCLLSDTNSNTDTSVENDDGGISKLFSDCRNLWSFNYVSPTSSSGETDSNVSNCEALTQTRVLNKPSIRSVGLNGTSYKARSIRSIGSNGKGHKTLTQIQTSDTSLIRRVGNKDMRCPLNIELDETTSQTSSDQYINERKAIKSSTILNSSSLEGGFSLTIDKPPKSKKPRSDKGPYSTNINFQQPNSSSSSICCSSSTEEPDREAIAQMKEMMYRAAAFRPVNFGIDDIDVIEKKPKRKNVKISNDPQTVVARQRREKISDRIRALQKIVPGGNKMDTASMLDEAANYLKFLRSQIKALECFGNKVNAMDCNNPTSIAFSFNPSFSMQMVPTSYNHHSQG
ncbi:unnamed protein product [Vicia faba]|uniref:BHLH domain-containing protein n=1 Tax=Vicia faba TaxID=3906 RepID=A0AAV1ACF8_VICFA|nr:unnamed protein product [Vicia faba]